MIQLRELYDGINRLLISSYPTVVVYTERQPKDFTRPSFLIEHIRTSKRDINCKTIEKTSYFTITGYLKVDSYYRSNSLELMELQDNVLNLFNQGYIKVGDRAVKLNGSSGGIDVDKIYIDLQFECRDDRMVDNDNEPIIKTIITSIQEV